MVAISLACAAIAAALVAVGMRRNKEAPKAQPGGLKLASCQLHLTQIHVVERIDVIVAKGRMQLGDDHDEDLDSCARAALS